MNDLGSVIGTVIETGYDGYGGYHISSILAGR